MSSEVINLFLYSISSAINENRVELFNTSKGLIFVVIFITIFYFFKTEGILHPSGITAPFTDDSDKITGAKELKCF